MKALLTTNLGTTPLLGRGKVRDLYAVDDALLLVATDRISAFDHVLATGIPGKGKILTQISLFWFDFLSSLVPNHLITANVDEFPAALRPYSDQLEGRSMLVRRAKMYPVECVARGYLAGSGWKEYKADGKVCGIPLAAGLQEKLFQPGAEKSNGFYAELPIHIQLTGSYHEFGAFVSGIAALPRIVTLHDIQITPIAKDKSAAFDQLQLDLTAKTYRYLDDQEIAAAEAEKHKADASKRRVGQ